MSNRRLIALNGLIVWVGASAVVLVMLGWMLYSMTSEGKAGPGTSTKELKVFCAAGIRTAMEPIAAEYEKEYGVKISFDFQGSGTLLSNIKVSKTGDLFLAADDSYIKLAKKDNLVQEEIPLAKMRPVILVQTGNPNSIQGIDDLLKDGIRVALGNPDQAAIGKKTRKLLTNSGHWDDLEKHVTKIGTFLPTVNEIANAVKAKSVDAAIVWDATANAYSPLETVRVSELDAGTSEITFGVLTASEYPTEALRFARYVGARDKGLKKFAESGFEVIEGDVWAEQPQLTFFAGAVNRRALEPIVRDFERREGVVVRTTFDGCGILTGTMKTIKDQETDAGFPDIFMACDVYYLDVVQDWFGPGETISDTDIVIAVPKSNPAKIESLEDLAKPNVRVVLGQPKQCTIGVLTKHLLKEEGIYDEVMKNVVGEKTSSALLVPSVSPKTKDAPAVADATLAYKTDCQAATDRVDIIPIDSPAAKAVQPYSIAKTSRNKQLARRLYEAIANSRENFEEAGFNWRVASPAKN